ncbi:hypothetical protein LMH87_004825 [Akanthomyces muscarius]|uniref:FAD-binding domain-containing protein n=1 Tax=Akanthomyces muscarius TaxID=2231603 RepID=A0A9W8UIH6_AKAMU|nr:hypothetical protein LMH87_004825 [Akanthomyces muscarius]KAJ4145994.1 hypothetical protein LMH87_004825 [Akanthomyces muscarius]
MTAPLRILISGSGIAGPATAFWLSRLGHKCTVIERHHELRTGGQQIDIRGSGLEAICRMGLLDQVRKHTVDEQGTEFIDITGNRRAFFPKSGRDEMQSFSGEYEIMRGDLCRIIFEATKQSVTYRFGLSIEDFTEKGKAVSVTLSDSSVETYDLIVGADGFSSRIRKKMLANFDPSREVKSLQTACAFYRVQRQPQDSDVCTFCILPGKRLLSARWHSKESGQGYLATMSRMDELRASLKDDVAVQKHLLAQIFADSGALGSRLVDAMMKADDFYMTEVAQVTAANWSNGNAVLVGDAGYCPSPFTGMGTSLALVGAYVLAGEISKHPGDLAEALASYDRTLRPYVTEIQKLPPGVPGILYPKTTWGVRMINFLIGSVSALKGDKIFGLFAATSDSSRTGWKMPGYLAMQI